MELMALIHASVEALDGSDALKQLVGICMRSSKPSSQLCGSIGIREKACGFVAFCKGCNGNGRVLLCLARMHRLAQNDYIKTKHTRSLII